MLTRLRGIAAHGLRPGAILAAEPLGDDTWRQLMVGVGRQRLEGLAAQAVVDGALAVTAEQAADLQERETAAAAQAVLLDRALLETAALLESSAVPVRVLKGSAVAHLDYPDPGLRQFGDIDLLMPASRVDRGIAALLDAGCVRPVAELAPGFDRRFGKGATLRRPDGIEVDVHRTLVAGTFGMRFDGDLLFESAEPFDVGGVELEALGPSERFLHACYHAALGDPVPRLVAVRDVAQMMRRPGFDWDHAMRVARSWAGEAVVARAVSLCSDVLEVEVDREIASWASEFRPSGRDRRAIDACLRADGRFARQAIGALPDVRGVRTKADYVFALAFPRGSHLAGRGQRRLSHLARAARRLREREQG